MIDLKLNTYYLTRDGKIRKIVEICSDKHVVNPFMSDEKVDYFPDGKVNLVQDSPNDLVREISHIGILMNIISESGLFYKISTYPYLRLGAQVTGLNTGPSGTASGNILGAFDILLTAYQEYLDLSKTK